MKAAYYENVAHLLTMLPMGLDLSVCNHIPKYLKSKKRIEIVQPKLDFYPFIKYQVTVDKHAMNRQFNPVRSSTSCILQEAQFSVKTVCIASPLQHARHCLSMPYYMPWHVSPIPFQDIISICCSPLCFYL